MLELNCLERLCLRILRKGHVPEHIAFIMDGNRRYAKTQKKAPLSGHQQGAVTLKRCLLYCLELGVKYASFYAFSLQNFNRKNQQVAFLMALARQQFRDLQEIDRQDNIYQIVKRHQVKVVIVGDLQGKLKQDFPDVRDSFIELQERTKNNTKMTLFLCFAYDSIFEINQAVKAHKQQQKNQQDSEQNSLLTQQKIFQKLLIPHRVDLMVRTSNQHRLSNFMLMQARDALIEIDKNFWPAFNILAMTRILMKYNFYYGEISARKKVVQSSQLKKQ